MKQESSTLDSKSHNQHLPHNWLWVKLGDISYINPRSIDRDLRDVTQVSFLPMKNVEEQTGKFDLSSSRNYKDVRKGYTPFVNKDIIFAKITPCMENGKIAIVDNLKNGVGFGSTEFHVIRLIGNLSKQFFFFYLMREDFRRKARRRMTGTAGQLRVPSKYMEEVMVALSPLQQQYRIVARLEELFTKLDAGIEYLKKTQILLKQYRQSVLKYAFEGKLTERWREEHKGEIESASTISNGREIESSNEYKISDDELSLLPAIPPNWVWTNIGSLFDVKPGSTPSRTKQAFWNGDIPWVSSSEVSNCNIYSTREKISQLGLENSSAKLHPPDTVLLAMIGEGKTRGQTAILKISATTNQNVAAILCAGSHIQSEYIFLWFMYRYTETRSKGSGGMQQALNAKLVKKLPVPLPGFLEQNEIVQKCNFCLSVIENMIKSIEDNLQYSNVLRKIILTKAFNGKLVSQDPNDEPASVLLEKLKQEKSIAESNNRCSKRNKPDSKQMRLT